MNHYRKAGVFLMKKPYTEIRLIQPHATEEMRTFVEKKYAGRALVICDDNTSTYAKNALPRAPRVIYPGDVSATDRESEKIMAEVRRLGDIRVLVACGSGTVHDLTRYAAHALDIPFISYPTAASVDGFVSGVAAMTIGGVKITTPAVPPIALFADPEVFSTAPERLTASGVGDIVGKYISLFDWRIGQIVNGEQVDEEIYALTEEALHKVMQVSPGDEEYTQLVMECLVISGMAIQFNGDSRPASAAEHHCSHLWEMHCINHETDALHGEKVGVATLLVLEEYKRLAREGFCYAEKADRFAPERLRPVFGELTEGILRENLPSSLDKVTPERLESKKEQIVALIDTLPETDDIRRYLEDCGAPVELAQLDLPDDEEFIATTLRWAPFVRNRLTLLKLTDCCRP